jgi:hypothetical protein
MKFNTSNICWQQYDPYYDSYVMHYRSICRNTSRIKFTNPAATHGGCPNGQRRVRGGNRKLARVHERLSPAPAVSPLPRATLDGKEARAEAEKSLRASRRF